MGIVTIAATPGEDLSGWTLESYAKSGNTATFRDSGNVDFSNPQVSASDPSIVYFTGNFALTTGNQRDAVALVDGNGSLVELVGWGNDNNFDLVGGTANGQNVSTSNGNFAGDNDQDWYARPPDSGWDGNNASNDDGLPDDIQPYSVPCFTAGTLIDTPSGRRMVETIQIGDLVLNDRGEAREVRWIGKRHIHLPPPCRVNRLRPVIIRAGAFGDGYPDKDLRLSPQHRIVVSGALCELYFGTDEVLVAVKHLINGTTVLLDKVCTSVEYLHILLDQHDILISNGLPSESLYPGPNTLNGLDFDQRDELFEIFPELQLNTFAYGKACLPVLRRVEACLI
jgi:hypothetical protein